jgi:hypothetical protein
MKNFYFQLPSFLFLFFLFLPANLSAQGELTREELRDVIFNKTIPNFQATNVIGTPYLLNAFQPGEVTLDNRKTTETIMLNYNIYENRIEYQDGNNNYAIDGALIREFNVQDPAGWLTFRKGFDARGLEPTEFVLVLTEGKATVLVKHEVSFQQDVAAYGTATQRDEYISRKTVYINNDGETERIRRLRERDILRFFGDLRSEMKQFASENNLDLDSLAGIKSLFEYYNSRY